MGRNHKFLIDLLFVLKVIYGFYRAKGDKQANQRIKISCYRKMIKNTNIAHSEPTLQMEINFGFKHRI